MATTASRHRGSYARPQQKTLPITMPTKAPAYNQPVSRVSISPPELSDTSTLYSGSRGSGGTFSDRSSAYSDSRSSRDHHSRRTANIDVMDELSERMNSAFDPIRMDRSLAKQAQTSGELNAKQRELAELQALAQRRLKKARVNFDEAVDAGREARRDLDYSAKRISAMKSRAIREAPDAYEDARRSRHASRR